MVQIPDVCKIQRIGHVCISVSNIDNSLSFYRDVLGMELILDVELPKEEVNFFQQHLNLKHNKMRVVGLKSTTGTTWLEIFQFSDPDPKPISSQERFCDIGICEVCLEVKDIEQTMKKLKDKGFTFLHPLKTGEMPSGSKIKYVCFKDPDGIFIELMQVGGSDY